MPMQTPQVEYDVVELKGGLDLVTPTLSMPPGVARDCYNFEASITGGYSRISGYERFDGRPAPSNAAYFALTATISGTIAVGNTITGLSSTATGVVIAVYGNDVYYTKAVGGFIVGEDIQVLGVTQGIVAATYATGTITNLQTAQLANLAADVYRADIGAVPGSGPIRGVVEINDVVYAWRDNAGGTALAIYKSSSSGWTSVTLGYELRFSTGLAAAIQDGDTITGASSGKVAVVQRVMLESGTWASGTAAGRLIFASATGNFTPGELIRVSGTNRATVVAAQTQITLLPGGRVETTFGNFSGDSRVYGCDGINRGFEFDGTVYAPIKTGMTLDTPSHVAVHKQHVFFSFKNSLQYSGIGAPYTWTVITGAGEIAMPETITALVVQPGDQSTGALAVYSDANTFVLYGTGSSNFNLVSYNVGAGAKPYSGQNVAQTYVFDNRGVITLQASLNYGNFDNAAVTLNIRPFTQARRNIVSASLLNREKAQYRVFFSDGYGLYVTIANNQMLGAMPVRFPNPVTCTCESQGSTGSESSFFGSDNGYVYALDLGTSFDGEDIPASLVLNYNPQNSPRMRKRYRRASFEVTGAGYSAFSFSYDLGYSSLQINQASDTNYVNNLSSSFWDDAYWDAFVWDGQTLAPTEVELVGTAENIQLRVSSTSDYYQPFTLNSVIIHFTQRRGLR